MRLRDSGCHDCQQSTSGDCGQHLAQVATPALPPTPLITRAQPPYKCPCCDGWGKRLSGPSSYVEDTGTVMISTGGFVSCPACNGSGLVWPPPAETAS